MNGRKSRISSVEARAPSFKKTKRTDGSFDKSQSIPEIPMQLMEGDSDVKQNANHLLMSSGINPYNLSDSQFSSFMQQNPAVQQKSIELYHQNLSKRMKRDSDYVKGTIDNHTFSFKMDDKTKEYLERMREQRDEQVRRLIW